MTNEELTKKLLTERLIYEPPYLYYPNTEAHMAIIRRDQSVSSEEEISEETNELMKEEGSFLPGIEELNATEDEVHNKHVEIALDYLQEQKNAVEEEDPPQDENDPPVAEENRSGWVDAIGEDEKQNKHEGEKTVEAEEDVTHFAEDDNPEQHIGEKVEYDLGEEETPKPQNRTSDGRFSS